MIRRSNQFGEAVERENTFRLNLCLFLTEYQCPPKEVIHFCWQC
jgi:hypothetical protein